MAILRQVSPDRFPVARIKMRVFEYQKCPLHYPFQNYNDKQEIVVPGYEWSPAVGLNTTAGPDVKASPVNDIFIPLQ